ncbi:MAG: hypothetical protein IIA09_19535 [Proteobacteria bacterium]|nr:hypothetical protein [Pseudomonadota bacterium]
MHWNVIDVTMLKHFAMALLVPFHAFAIGSAATADDHNAKIDRALAAASKWPGVIRSAIGVTRQGTTIPCLISADDLDHNTSKTRILLVGGLDGWPISVRASLQAMQWFYTSDDAKRYRKDFAVSAVPIVTPDAWAMKLIGSNGSGGTSAIGYPPQGVAYSDPKSPEAIYLWRWIGMHAPDLVVVTESGSSPVPFFPTAGGDPLARLRLRLGGATLPESNDLASQLVRQKPAGVGSIPAFRLDAPNSGRFLKPLLATIEGSRFRGPSPARRELQRRLKRTPVEVALQLSEHYGHGLDTVAYIPALALIGRIRLPRSGKSWKQYYRKVGTRKAQAISKVCFAGLAEVEGGTVRDIRIALGSVAPTVIRCVKTEAVLKGQKIGAAALDAAKAALAEEISPIDDFRSTARYRLRVAQNLLGDFLLNSTEGREQRR